LPTVWTPSRVPVHSPPELEDGTLFEGG